MVRTKWMGAVRKAAVKKSVLLLVALALAFGGCAGEAEREGNVVKRVVDGDTIIVSIEDKDERLRLIGVDTPESVHPDQSKNVPYGKVASDFTKEQLEGKTVTLEFDVQERDRYGRLLAYVYVDGEMFNETLLKEGHAKVATFPPNVKYVERFTELQREAREAQKGLWEEEIFVADESEPKGEMPVDKEQQEAAYIGNVNTKKYHRSNCRSVSQIKEGYAIPLEPGDLEDYVPCKICLP